MEKRQETILFFPLGPLPKVSLGLQKSVYLDKIPRAANEAREIGRLLHQLVADYLERLILHNCPTDWEWAQGAASDPVHPGRCRGDLGALYNNYSLLLQGLKAPGWETGWPSTASGAPLNSTPSGLF